MSRLTTVELRRLFSRRLVVVAMLAALLVSGLILVTTWMSTQPMSAAQVEQAERAYDQAQADWAEHGEEQVAECEEAEERESELTGEEMDFGCESMEPQREWFFFSAPPLEVSLPSLLSSASALVLLITFAIGTTFFAAEISTGAISNWLTFEPRRTRVYASKLVAAAVGVVPITLLVLGLLTVGAWFAHDQHGLADGMTTAAWVEAGWTIARITLVAVLAAAVGAALGSLLRHTAAVLGLVVAYAVVVESMVRALLPAFQPWLLQVNLTAWVDDGTAYFTRECTVQATGTSCEMVEHTLTLGHGAVYLGVLAVVVLVLGALVFRRRDVA